MLNDGDSSTSFCCVLNDGDSSRSFCCVPRSEVSLELLSFDLCSLNLFGSSVVPSVVVSLLSVLWDVEAKFLVTFLGDSVEVMFS